MSFAMYSLSGLAIGFLVGMTGVGGGSLMTPLLILLFGIHPSTAVGSDLLYASMTKVVGTGFHSNNGSVDWRITRLLAYGSVPSTLVTIGILVLHPAVTTNPHFISVGLGLVLLVTALLLICRGAFVSWFAPRLDSVSPAGIRALTIMTGVVLGFAVTFTSVGAGAIGVTALTVLYPRVAAVRIVGSDLAHAVPLTLLAGLGHWAAGDVNFGLVGSLLLGSIPGVALGSLLSFRVPDMVLRVVLALALTAASARLLA